MSIEAIQEPVSLYRVTEAQLRTMPIERVLLLASNEMNSRARALGYWFTEKPVVRVFKAQGQALFVLRIGGNFVASFTWDLLIRKAANPRAWQPVRIVERFRGWEV